MEGEKRTGGNMSNQNEKEQESVAQTGRKGLELAVQKMAPEIMALAAPDVVKAGNSWMQRAIISVVNDDNPKVRECLQTRVGQMSVIKCFEEAATMGLQLGGQFKHAHITAFDGKAELIVDQNGLKFMTCHGHGAVLRDIVIRRVYEGEQFRIDFADNAVVHSYDGKAERGKLVGVYGILTKLDSEKVVEYMTRTEALHIRDHHSRGYAAFKAGRTKDNFWHSDEDAAIEKTAAKKFLRPFAAKSEGISMFYSNEESDDEGDSYQPAPRDVSDRMSGHLDAKVEKAAAAPAKAKPAPEPAAAAETVEDVPEGEQGDAPAELF
jgi:recombinational DNA repair protein RecT